MARGDERGAAIVEYVLLLCLVALACTMALTYLGGSTSQTIDKAGHSVGGTPIVDVTLPPASSTTTTTAPTTTTTVPGGGHDGGGGGG